MQKKSKALTAELHNGIKNKRHKNSHGATHEEQPSLV
jgi:hypothetical protein